jgi:Peptidase family M23/PA14 domain
LNRDDVGISPFVNRLKQTRRKTVDALSIIKSRKLVIALFLALALIFGKAALAPITQAEDIPTAYYFTQPVTNPYVQLGYLGSWPYCNDAGTLGVLHPALDLTSTTNDLNIHAIGNGKVYDVHTHTATATGNHVVIEHVLPSGEHIYTNYGHLASIASGIAPGTIVTMGQVIGIMGKTGTATGVHLHFEVRTGDIANMGMDAWPPTCYPIQSNGDLSPADRATVTAWIDGGDWPRYTNPDTFFVYSNVANGVTLFKDTYYRGGSVRLESGGLYNLTTISGGSFNRAVSSIAIPHGWSVKLYQNPDGTGASKYLEWNDISFARNGNTTNPDTFDGTTTTLNDNAQSIRVYQNQCPQASVSHPGVLALVSVAEAACSDPTATPASLPPTQPPSSEGIQVVSVPSITVGTGQQFQPSITIKLTSGSINASTDFLKATPDTATNKLGAYVNQGFTHNVSADQPYTFDGSSTTQFRMTAPSIPGTFYSYWRLWIGGAFKGPTIAIQINVTGDPPAPVGWATKYYNCTSPNGECAAQYETTEQGTYLFRDWGIGGPGHTINNDNWSASFTRNVHFDGGQYRFHSNHDDKGTVKIDGQTVLDGQQSSEQDSMINLNAGDHTIRVEYVEQTGSAHIEVWWQGPGYLPSDQTCDPLQWCASYWGINHTAGTPAITRNEGYGDLARDWHSGNLGYDFPGDYFSALYTRQVAFTCGTYRFDIGGDDSLSLYIDGVQYGANVTTFDLPMSDGIHVVQAYYSENTGDAFFHATWSQLTTCSPTATLAPTITPTPALPNAVTLLASPGWTLQGNNGDAQASQSIEPNSLIGRTTLRVTYNLHGITAIGGDASALIFDQPVNGDWRYVSLSGYGTNGLNGSQTVDIPLSAFPGLNLASQVGTLHARIWYGSAFTVDITSIIAYGSGTSPTSTPTAAPTSTPTATPTPSGGTELLTGGAWHLSGNNGDDQASQSISSSALQGKSTVRITYNLHGLTALDGDASAVIFDQPVNGDWHYISLSDYGTNGLNGSQTVTIPLSDFGLNLSQSVGTLHARFWYGSGFTVDITSITVQ